MESSSSVDNSVLSTLTMMEEDEHHPHQFSSSIWKLHNNAPITTSVHDLLECPVCTSSMYPPIHQCHNGHTICSTCKTRVHNRCPTCRQELGDIRCLALEKIAELLELPCRYISLGCPEIFPYYSKLNHEAICNYRPYNCPYAGSDCSVVGDIPYLVAHLRDDHKVDMHSGCTFNHRYVKSNPMEVENVTWMLTVFHCFGQYFCLHFEAFQLGMALVYMAFLRFMGDEREAKNYAYSLEVGGNGRKLTFEGSPRSIRDSHKKVKDSHDGLIIYRNMAFFFSGKDRKELKLRVTGRIWKEQQNPEGVVGAGIGLISKHQKSLGLANVSATYAANFAIVAGCYCEISLQRPVITCARAEPTLHRRISTSPFVGLSTRKNIRSCKEGCLHSERICVLVMDEVYHQSIAAVSILDWPKERMLVQVLDDSDEVDIQQLIKAEVHKWQQRGVRIIYRHRLIRTGYKAGNLKSAMSCDYVKDYEFVAIFDADFQPSPDFLKKTIPYFKGKDDLALVQTRWAFVNKDENLLTRLQNINLSFHFEVEQQVNGIFINFFGFNGTAGVWRIKALEESGGWLERTTVEDMDIAVRAHLCGWYFSMM